MSAMHTGEVLDAIDAIRAGVIALARAEISTAAVKGSREVRQYWRDVGACVGAKPYNDFQLHQAADSKEWCGVFALWVLREAGLIDIPWRQGVGFARGRLPVIAKPEPADLFIGPAPMWHHGIVETHTMLEIRPWLKSIEGNTPCVSAKNRPAPADPIYRDGKIIGWREQLTYYSILPLIKRKLGIEQ